VSPTANEPYIAELGLIPPGWVIDGWTNKPFYSPIHISEDYPFAGFISDLRGTGGENHQPIEVVIYEVELQGLEPHIKQGFDGPGTLQVNTTIEPWRLTKIGYHTEPTH
jgi:hypothetical protein